MSLNASFVLKTQSFHCSICTRQCALWLVLFSLDYERNFFFFKFFVFVQTFDERQSFFDEKINYELLYLSRNLSLVNSIVLRANTRMQRENCQWATIHLVMQSFNSATHTHALFPVGVCNYRTSLIVIDSNNRMLICLLACFISRAHFVREIINILLRGDTFINLL